MSAHVLDIGAVIAHMQAQLGSLRVMSDLLEEQEAAVREGRGDLVLDAVSRFRGELAERVKLEEQRERLIAQWAGQLGCAPQEVTASRLAELSPQHGAQLRSLSEQLHQEALRVQAQQRHTQALMRSELQFVSSLVDALYPGRQTGAYTPGSPTPATPGALTLDVKG